MPEKSQDWCLGRGGSQGVDYCTYPKVPIQDMLGQVHQIRDRLKGHCSHR